ncbi:hypothetical protein QLL95_gp1078 [Cotonvirus japonicus]|uniref:Uncharacterized protein n=1 Tax=Cotonvirus japonicus TaxID=2811091 RepID=A0ABM7NSA3_9VIRU|nr:hypothetical protein QLL95_gp1078 [Cotonvirus japonicus]BCS83045.1 hypothetical protein [Cotonvirus japonicus]
MTSHNNIFNILNNVEEENNSTFFKKKIRNRAKKVNFPETHNFKNIITTEENMFHAPEIKNINYSNAARQTSHNEEKQYDQNDDSIIVGNKIIIPHETIVKLYKFYGIYRIKMLYISLNRQKHILDSVRLVNPKKSIIFDEVFNYSEIVHRESMIKKCLNVCILYQKILSCYKIILNILSGFQAAKNSPEIYVQKSEEIIKREFSMANHIIEYLDDTMSKYKPQITEYLLKINNFIADIKSLHNTNILDLSSTMSLLYFDTEKYLEKIIEDNDPHINCEYYVNMYVSTPDCFEPVGLKYCTSIKCEDNIDLSTKNKHYNNLMLYHITQEKLREIFNKVKRDNNDDFIRIFYYNPNHSMCNNLNINYNLLEETPFFKMSVEISDLPENSNALTCTIINPILEIMDNDIIPYPLFTNKTINIHNNASDINDLLHVLSEEEYDKLHEDWKNRYSYHDINYNSNNFTVRYLFNELQSNDIIKLNMFDSFIDLVNQKSVLN